MIIERRHHKRLWIAILVISMVVRIGVAFYLGDHIEVLPGIHDQLAYDQLSLSLLAGNGYEFTSAWYPFTSANTPTAHWSFLYPLYLSAVYAIFGYHPLIARLLQAALAGIILPWLIYRLGSRLFDRMSALVGAGIIAFYGYFLYHNAALMTETFFIIGILWVFDIAYSMVDSYDDKNWWLLGIVMGGTILLRQTYLVFVPVLLVWLFYSISDSVSLWRPVLAIGLIALCILPWTLRNYVQFNEFLLLNSNAGYAFYTANHPSHGNCWDPNFTAPIPLDLAGANEAKLDHVLMSRGLTFVMNDPVRYIKLTLSRIPYHFRFWPTPDSRLISVFVRMVSFGLYLPFMLYGLVLSRRKWRRLMPVYLFAFIFVSIHILSWPGARYRFPVDAVFMIFGGLGVSTLLKKVPEPISKMFLPFVQERKGNA